jgi:hypothetical protein
MIKLQVVIDEIPQFDPIECMPQLFKLGLWGTYFLTNPILFQLYRVYSNDVYTGFQQFLSPELQSKYQHIYSSIQLLIQDNNPCQILVEIWKQLTSKLEKYVQSHGSIYKIQNPENSLVTTLARKTQYTESGLLQIIKAIPKQDDTIFQVQNRDAQEGPGIYEAYKIAQHLNLNLNIHDILLNITWKFTQNPDQAAEPIQIIRLPFFIPQQNRFSQIISRINVFTYIIT